MPSYVIVGASRGLGYEWLRQLSTDPENTIIGLVRTPASVEAKLSSDKIANVHILQADMADYVALNNAAQEVSKITKGSLDYLIVNGVYSDGDHNRLTPTAFTGHEEVLRREMIRSLDVNVVGVIYSINAFLPLVRKSTIKKVVALTTGLADTDMAPKSGVPNYVVYTSMKAALNMVIARYSVELREDGIVFLALSPGVVLTSEKPPTAEDMADFQRLKQAVLKIKPEWQGPMIPSESVQLQKQVIEKATIDESGSFLSHFGNKEWI